MESQGATHDVAPCSPARRLSTNGVQEHGSTETKYTDHRREFYFDRRRKWLGRLLPPGQWPPLSFAPPPLASPYPHRRGKLAFFTPASLPPCKFQGNQKLHQPASPFSTTPLTCCSWSSWGYMVSAAPAQPLAKWSPPSGCGASNVYVNKAVYNKSLESCTVSA